MVKDSQSLDWRLAVMLPSTLGHGYVQDMRVHTGADYVQKVFNSVRGQAAWTLQAPGGLVTVSAPGHDKNNPPTGLPKAWMEGTGEAVELSLRSHSSEPPVTLEMALSGPS